MALNEISPNTKKPAIEFKDKKKSKDNKAENPGNNSDGPEEGSDSNFSYYYWKSPLRRNSFSHCNNICILFIPYILMIS
jgi:hypothetical protein